MPAETDLTSLLRRMRPGRRPGTFVFVTVPEVPAGVPVAATVHEAEGVTLVVAQDEADARGWTYEMPMAWLTLHVHSALQAVGLTAAVSQALASTGIAANVLAGTYHDHICVPIGDAQRALDTLLRLSAAAGEVE